MNRLSKLTWEVQLNVLELRDIVVHYEKVEALKGVSLTLPEGMIVALIGSNGAGKSTILRTISGVKKPTRGEVWFQDKRIDLLSPSKIVGMGIIHIPEGRGLFPDMTVLENLFMGAYLRKDKKAVKTDMERVFELFPVLKERQKQWAGSLSGGEQQMLAVGRGLMSKPKVLLLDEPSLGLSPIIVELIMGLIPQINQMGVSILLVEQNAYEALKVAQQAYVVETGKILMSGEASKLIDNEFVRKAYLGM